MTRIFWFLGPISKGRGAKRDFADTYENSPPYLLKNIMSLKKFQVIWQPYLVCTRKKLFWLGVADVL